MILAGHADLVTVDLDDTLYPQAEWLDGAWRAVAAEGARRGLEPETLHRALLRTCAQGSDRGRIIDRALGEVGIPANAEVPAMVPAMVAVFTAHRPARLTPYPGVVDALTRLAEAVPVICVTDGPPDVQRAKVRALGLAGLLAGVVVSDELGGRALRKPHPAPFLRALELAGASADRAVHIGDRPDKDVDGAVGAGLRAIRVRTGEYAALGPAAHRPLATFDTFALAAQACHEGTPASLSRL